MSGTDLTNLDRDALVGLILQQAATIQTLQTRIEELTRSGKRQAAPFSKGIRTENPRKPGRKPGQGPFKRRMAPTLEQLAEPPIPVPLADPACSGCGGELAFERLEDASITDLPPIPRPRVRPFQVAVHRCSACGDTTRGHHPELAADQRGATAHRFGPRLMAAAHHLHYGLGVPVRKLPEVLRLLAGVTITQGAITQDALRQGLGPVGAKSRELADSIRHAPYVHTDDTGWREGGTAMWLMTFVTDTATVYQIRPRHRNDEVRECIPGDYAGVMITDRGKSYDAVALAAVKQQKCLSHVQRSIAAVLETKVGPARQFARTLKGLLKQALRLWHERRAGPVVSDFAERVAQVVSAVTRHLRDRVLPERDDQRLLDGLGGWHDSGSLLRFLDDPTIEPTNNRAERSLRPAVIARKVSQCTKTARGTRAFEAWTSVLNTFSRTVSGAALLDAIVGLVHPAASQPA